MFFKLPLLATAAFLATLAAAAPTSSPPAPGTTNQCCSTVGTNANPVVSAVAALLGVNISDILGNIGVGCTVITALGNTCSNTAVNCDSSQLGNGLINVGCVPITL
ncbi:fungal hydrophobin [Mycena pura]|uniref:Hydrophobin n=1 Tax=Mycena pura TaxID=153505 RepID=A0AAD6V4N0_9AGAR|nr:fungal hydrophobin [Mycena pura]